MIILDKLLGNFLYHVAVMNENGVELKREIAAVKKKYGKGFLVKGFSSHKELFFEVRLAKENNNPYVAIFLKKDKDISIENILKYTTPNIKTYKYFNMDELKNILYCECFPTLKEGTTASGDEDITKNRRCLSY